MFLNCMFSKPKSKSQSQALRWHAVSINSDFLISKAKAFTIWFSLCGATLFHFFIKISFDPW